MLHFNLPLAAIGFAVRVWRSIRQQSPVFFEGNGRRLSVVKKTVIALL
jgi:hypothetical protein